MLTTFQIDACSLAIKNMMKEGRFSICVIDNILKITGGVPNREDYDALRLLHCIDFKDFPPRMRIEFPNILRRVLEAPGMEITITFKALGTGRMIEI